MELIIDNLNPVNWVIPNKAVKLKTLCTLACSTDPLGTVNLEAGSLNSGNPAQWCLVEPDVPGGAALVHPTGASRAPALAPIPSNIPGSQSASQEGRKKTEIPVYDETMLKL